MNLSKEIETASAKYHEYYLSINKCPTNAFTTLRFTFIVWTSTSLSRRLNTKIAINKHIHLQEYRLTDNINWYLSNTINTMSMILAFPPYLRTINT